MQIDIQLMVSFPMFRTNESTIATRLPNLMTPMMLIRVHGELSDDLFQMLFIGIMLIPKCVGWIRLILIILGACILIGYVYCLHFFLPPQQTFEESYKYLLPREAEIILNVKTMLFFQLPVNIEA
ncbi:hypothetical protein LOAG_07629 [Loa loa]|uniref:Uncharacterized protein n=1 Tax=Loa loa TaxID=7209 RepID=A0A1S0TV72_LOALO|nr:hypothetical protein LOAG_07629 [Loa loa]EFO20859.1 hypothetical protein LOAG_07629 [Loa loa]